MAPEIDHSEREVLVMVLALIVLFLLASPMVQGQTQTGSVSGVVYGFTCGDDVIPLTEATVAAVLIRTGYTPQLVMTDTYGVYRLVLFPGEYKIFVTADFFQTQGSYSFTVALGTVLSDLIFYLYPATPAYCPMIQYQNFLLSLPIYSNGSASKVFYDITVRSLSFTINAANDSARRFLVVIPRALLNGTPIVIVDNSEAKSTLLEGSDYFFVTFEASVGSHEVAIQGSNDIPEFSRWYPLVGASLSLVAVFVAGFKRTRKKSSQHS